MIRNYLTIALRNIRRHKGHTLINIAGLAVGMATCILIMLWVIDEVAYDRFHAKSDRLYRIYERWQEEDFNLIHAFTSIKLSPLLKDAIPGIEKSARVTIDGPKLIMVADEMYEKDIVATADPDFLEMFDYPLLSGDASTALSAKMSVILTESVCRKYFGEARGLGQMLKIEDRDFTVTGIMNDPPHNSHLRFDCLVPFESMPDEQFRIADSWDEVRSYTYVLLYPGSDPVHIGIECDLLIARHSGHAHREMSKHLQPITDIHLNREIQDRLDGHGDIKTVYLFAVLAAVTLLIGCINFINLWTARAPRRAVEVGIRRVAGAQRVNLVGQFLGEAIVNTLVALALALLIAELVIPLLNSWSGKQLTLLGGNNELLLPLMTGLVLVTGLAAGIYPALKMSNIHPARIFKGSVHFERSGLWTRRALVVAQFALAGGLAIATLVIYRQMRHVASSDLGFNPERVVYFTMPNGFAAQYPAIKEQLQAHPGVEGVSAGCPPVRSFPSAIDPWWEGKTADREVEWSSLASEWDFPEMMGMTVRYGTGFRRDHINSRGAALLVNSSAARAMGLDNPVGVRFAFNRHNSAGGGHDVTPYEGVIVGVLNDFNNRSLHHAVSPVVVFVDPAQAKQICVRIRPGYDTQVLGVLEGYWRRFVPGRVFDYYFIDDTLNEMYRPERSLEVIVAMFTGLAIVVSCLGLFGLATFMAERRTREIGIRKVLGATVGGVVMMLSREIVLLVLVANLAIWPLAWLVLTRWLQNFAYRIDIGLVPPLAACALALALALVSVISQSFRAARANPVDSLKYE